MDDGMRKFASLSIYLSLECLSEVEGKVRKSNFMFITVL